MHRRSLRSRLSFALALALLIPTLAFPPAAGAIDVSIEILYAPESPLVANTSYGFTAKIDPSIDDATIEWRVNGVLFATDLTNPNGVSQEPLVFGPGGYGVTATLIGTDDYDYAFSQTVVVQVEPDPTKLPDRFSWAGQGGQAQTASGDDVQVDYFQTGAWPSNHLIVKATSLSTDAKSDISLTGPEGSPLAVGVYNPANTPRQAIDDAEGTVGNCDNGVSTGGFAVLNLVRGPNGFPLGFTILAEYRCANMPLPRVAWIRYNDSTPIPSLSLPDASPYFGSRIVGDEGEPVSFPITNDGEVPVELGEVGLTGADASAWELGDDSCSAATLAPGASCSFALTFTPSATGTQTAMLVLPSDLPVSPRRLRIEGWGLIPTSLSAPVVTPETQYLAHGVRFTTTVSPSTEANTVSCELDGDTIPGSGLTNSTGFCLAERPADGTHEVRMHYAGSPFDGPSTSPLTTFTVDSTTTTALAVTPGTHWSNVPVTLTATTSFSGDLAYPGGNVTIEDTTTDTVLGSGSVGPDARMLHVTTKLAQGPHHLVATYAGIEGVQVPSEAAIDVTVGPPDLVTPRASTPTERILEGSLDDGYVPVRLAWVGDDGGSGIDHYQVRRRIDGHAWTMLKSSLKATQLDLRLAPWRKYQFEVRAIDGAGNASAWSVAPAFFLDGIPDADPRVTYKGPWTRASGESWWNAQVRRSTAPGATATVKFIGRDAAWVTSVGPARGQAKVYVDGVLRKTIDLYAAVRKTRVVAWSTSWASAGRHTVVIRVTGTVGRPMVDVDGFVITR